MFWNIFLTLCSNHDKSPNAVCKELKLSNATATHWKNGSKPNDSTLKKIADYFNINIDELKKEQIKEKALPEQEEPNIATKRLMELYNELNTEGQEKLLDYADDLVTSRKYTNNEETVRIYRAAHSDTNNPAEIKVVGKDYIKKLEEAPETDEDF